MPGNLTFDELLRAQALEHVYLSPGADLAPAPHLTWHGPFLYATADEGVSRQLERARRAGELWLRNFDLRTACSLVLSHLREPWSFVFSRAQRPGQAQQIAGPMPVRLVLQVWQPTPCGSFAYAELDEVVRFGVRTP
jgi:hypothetical protein